MLRSKLVSLAFALVMLGAGLAGAAISSVVASSEVHAGPSRCNARC